MLYVEWIHFESALTKISTRQHSRRKMLANVLRRGVAQAARGQVRKMSLGEQLKDVKDVKVKDAVRFFGDKAKDPAVQQAARVCCAPPRICGCDAAVRLAVARGGAAGSLNKAEAVAVRRAPRIWRTCGRDMRGLAQTPPPQRTGGPQRWTGRG